jgi:hypothetical protein
MGRKDGESFRVLLAGEEAPAWAEEILGDHLFEDADRGDGDEPPRSGKGSGKDAWAEFAAEKGVDIGDAGTREDIIAVLVAAGVIEE